MPRVQTGAQERTAQNHRLVDEVATEFGTDSVTVRQAVAARQARKGVHDIVQRPIPTDDPNLDPIGVVLAKAGDFKIIAGGTAYLSITTNAREFGMVLQEATLRSPHEILAVAIYAIPRNLGLPDEDDDEGED